VRDAKGEFVSAGSLYGLCLHSGLQRALAPFQGDGVHRHEWPVFKQQLPGWLATERRELLPIVIGDPAYLDVLYWTQQKLRRQATIITREKENMQPTVISHHAFDPQDPVNRGVEADEMAGYTYAYLRRITYCDPATGERFVFSGAMPYHAFSCVWQRTVTPLPDTHGRAPVFPGRATSEPCSNSCDQRESTRDNPGVDAPRRAHWRARGPFNPRALKRTVPYSVNFTPANRM